MNSAAVPIRVEWRLRTPWCPPELGLHLDGRVARALYDGAMADGSFTTFDDLHAQLPFERYTSPDTGQSVWMASMLIPHAPTGFERRHLTRRTDVVAMSLAMSPETPIIAGKPMSMIDTSRGFYKNASVYYSIQHVDRVYAYCIGDPDRLVALLGRVHSLGKRTRLGHGVVVETVKVVEDEEAWTKWRLRHMPEAIEGYAPVHARLEPPYWQGEGRVMAWRPLAFG